MRKLAIDVGCAHKCHTWLSIFEITPDMIALLRKVIYGSF